MILIDEFRMLIGTIIGWAGFFSIAVFVGYKLGRSVQRANGWRGWRIRFRHWRQNWFPKEDYK